MRQYLPRSFIAAIALFSVSINYASVPVWTFTPIAGYLPTVSLTEGEFRNIQYTVTNISRKIHTLAMKPIPGIQQITTDGNCPNPFTLGYQQSCTLNLRVDGSQLKGNVHGGPVVCQIGNTLQCYQPSASNGLDIILGTLYAGTLNGSVYFSTDKGLTWQQTTIPSTGNAANSVFATKSSLYVGSADNKVYYSNDNGKSWKNTHPVPDKTAVNGIVAKNDKAPIYAVTQGGAVYYSTDKQTWKSTGSRPGSEALNSIFINPEQIIYVGSADGNIYYSINNGATWNKIFGPSPMFPNASIQVQNVFIAQAKLFINTRETTLNPTLPSGTIDFEYAYFADLNNPSVWTLLSQISYTLFVNSEANAMYVGTQGGYVFSLTTGEELGFISYSPITSLFFLG